MQKRMHDQKRKLMAATPPPSLLLVKHCLRTPFDLHYINRTASSRSCDQLAVSQPIHPSIGRGTGHLKDPFVCTNKAHTTTMTFLLRGSCSRRLASSVNQVKNARHWWSLRLGELQFVTQIIQLSSHSAALAQLPTPSYLKSTNTAAQMPHSL